VKSSFRKKVSIQRAGAGDYVAGRWVSGSPVTIEIFSSVQPVSGAVLDTLPENRKSKGVFALYSDFEFRKGGRPGEQPDRTTIGGDVFECFAVEPWKNGILEHFKAYFGKVDE